LIEKYHIADGVPREGGGGEYPLQDGFGWTNGVVRRLIGLYGERRRKRTLKISNR
uniref:trehalase family glycosidase n=1 Tax=Escherichia coli TaxID=562 RepID=UPI0013AEDB4A